MRRRPRTTARSSPTSSRRSRRQLVEKDRSSSSSRRTPRSSTCRLQPDGRLRPAGLSVSADLLPAYPAGSRLRDLQVGVMWGAAVWGGSCCGCGWGGEQHLHQQQQQLQPDQPTTAVRRQRQLAAQPAAPRRRAVCDKATANKYGGSTRGGSPSNRQRGRTAGGRQPGPAAATRRHRRQGGRPPGGAGRDSAPEPGIGAAARIPRQRPGRQPRCRASSRPNGGFSGGSRGYSGNSARASSSRGASSMGGRGGGGGGRRRCGDEHETRGNAAHGASRHGTGSRPGPRDGVRFPACADLAGRGAAKRRGAGRRPADGFQARPRRRPRRWSARPSGSTSRP